MLEMRKMQKRERRKILKLHIFQILMKIHNFRNVFTIRFKISLLKLVEN